MQDSPKKEICLSDQQKLEVLLHALEERYKSIHIIRERVQNISLWTLGLFVTAGGWLLQSTTDLTMKDKLFLGLMVVLTVIVLRAFYLKDLEKGFKAQQRIQAKIENTLGLCRPGVFGADSIYPEVWSNAGSKNGKGNFFFHNYLLIYTGTFFLLVSIWLH